MDNLSFSEIKEITALFTQLLPGFVSTWLFYALTAYRKISAFERIAQALVFTVFISLCTSLTENILMLIGHYFFIANWSNPIKFVWSIFYSLVIGLLFSYFSNNDAIHTRLRKLGITTETSYPSEWFREMKGARYIIIQMEGRRISGFVDEYPSDPSFGHFVLSNPAWLISSEENKTENLLTDGQY